MKKLLRNKKIRITLWVTAAILAACILLVLVCNVIVLATAAPLRYHEDTLPRGEAYDCILVLGAGVKEDGSLSNLLRDRMTVGISLMEKGIAPVLLLTGARSRTHALHVWTQTALTTSFLRRTRSSRRCRRASRRIFQ